MKLIQELMSVVQYDEDILEHLGITEFFDSKKTPLEENIKSFVAGAEALIDRIVINTHNSKFDDKDKTVPGDENEDGKFADDDIILRFARLVAGLEYFRRKKIGPDEIETISNVLDDKHTTVYVKKIGQEKAEDIVKEILDCFYKGRLIHKDKIQKMIDEIRSFYINKKANTGPKLSIATTESSDPLSKRIHRQVIDRFADIISSVTIVE